MFVVMQTNGDITIPPQRPADLRLWIKYQLGLRGITLTDIATALGVHRNAVSKALRSSYPRVEREIARRLELLPEQLWPDRYQKSDRRGTK